MSKKNKESIEYMDDKNVVYIDGTRYVREDESEFIDAAEGDPRERDLQGVWLHGKDDRLTYWLGETRYVKYYCYEVLCAKLKSRDIEIKRLKDENICLELENKLACCAPHWHSAVPFGSEETLEEKVEAIAEYLRDNDLKVEQTDDKIRVYKETPKYEVDVSVDLKGEAE